MTLLSPDECQERPALQLNYAYLQGWIRDVKARDRDETETLSSLAERRPRRDACSSRDVIETLKYKFY